MTIIGEKRIATLLFSDMVDSTRVKNRGSDFYARRLERHRELIRNACARHEGNILQFVGDGTLIEFSNPVAVVEAALAIQHAFFDELWEKTPVHLRIGIHSGEVLETGKTDVPFVGLALDMAARIQSLALPDQILMSRPVADSAREALPAIPGTGWRAHGFFRFKGVEDEALEIFEVGWIGRSPLKCPPNAAKAVAASDKTDQAMLGWRPGSGETVPGAPGWRLERKLGEGGFGEVWLASLDDNAEKKIFKFCFHSDRRRSFQVEKTMSRYLVNQLGVRDDLVPIDMIHLDSFPFYIASEYIAGGNLAQWSNTMGGVGNVPLEQRLALLIDTARAAAAAHGIGVIHKDIKPANVLVDESGGAPHARLIDFGIGAMADPSLLDGAEITRLGLTGKVLADNISSRTFTRIYAPPEYLTGAPASVRGDIYALGVLLYQLVIGDLEKPLPSDWRATVSDELLAEDIARCVAGDPEDRFASADELVKSLSTLPERRAALISARLSEQRAIRRQRLTRAGLAAGVCLALITAASVWGYITAKRAREEAERQRDRAITLFTAGQEFVDGTMNDVGTAMFVGQDFDLKSTRRLLLEVVSNYLEQIEHDAPVGDYAFTNHLIKTNELLSNYLAADGETTAAARAARKAGSLLRSQAERNPDDIDLQLALASNINDQLSLPVHPNGGLLSPEEQCTRLHEIIGILEPLVHENALARSDSKEPMEDGKAKNENDRTAIFRRFSIGHLWGNTQLNLILKESFPIREKITRLQAILPRVHEFRESIPRDGEANDYLRGCFDELEFSIRVSLSQELLETAPDQAYQELDAIELWCDSLPADEESVRRRVDVQMRTLQYARWLHEGDFQKAQHYHDQVIALCQNRNDDVSRSCLAQLAQTRQKYAGPKSSVLSGGMSNLAPLRKTAQDNPCDTGALMNWAGGLTMEILGMMPAFAESPEPGQVRDVRILLEKWYQASQSLLSMDAPFLQGTWPVHGWRAFSGLALHGLALSYGDEELSPALAEDVVLISRLGLHHLSRLLADDPDPENGALEMMDNLGEFVENLLFEHEELFQADPRALRPVGYTC